MDEIWENVPGFDGVYQISNHGRIKSFIKDKFGKILSATNKKGGYLSVILVGKNFRKSVRLHRLVAELFVQNPFDKKIVHHIDGNKQNNKFDNLAWVTTKEHAKISVNDKPSIVSGINQYNKFKKTRPVSQYTIDGRYIATYPNCKEASLATGVCHRNIHQVAGNSEYRPGLIRHQAGGYQWKYCEGREYGEN